MLTFFFAKMTLTRVGGCVVVCDTQNQIFWVCPRAGMLCAMTYLPIILVKKMVVGKAS